MDTIKFLDDNFNFRQELLLEPQSQPNMFTKDGTVEWEKLPEIDWDQEFLSWLSIPWIGHDEPHTKDMDALYCVLAGTMRAACNLFNWVPLWDNFGTFIADDILPVWRVNVDQVVCSLYTINEVLRPWPKLIVDIWLFDQKDFVLKLRKRADYTVPRYNKGSTARKDAQWVRFGGESPRVSATPTESAIIMLSLGFPLTPVFCAITNRSGQLPKYREQPYDLYIRKEIGQILAQRPWEGKPSD